MRAALGLLLAATSLAACQTTSTATPPAPEPIFSESYRLPADHLARCLTDRSRPDWQPFLRWNGDQAHVILARKGTHDIVAEYTVRKAGDGASIVDWRRAGQPTDPNMDRRARDTMEACGRG
jgi:hypothetical protein